MNFEKNGKNSGNLFGSLKSLKDLLDGIESSDRNTLAVVDLSSEFDLNGIEDLEKMIKVLDRLGSADSGIAEEKVKVSLKMIEWVTALSVFASCSLDDNLEDYWDTLKKAEKRLAGKISKKVNEEDKGPMEKATMKMTLEEMMILQKEAGEIASMMKARVVMETLGLDTGLLGLSEGIPSLVVDLLDKISEKMKRKIVKAVKKKVVGEIRAELEKEDSVNADD